MTGVTIINQDHSSSRDRVADLVQQLLARRAITKSVSHEEDLRDVGISSLDMVNLMLSVEGEFGLTIPETQMTPANFRSIASIDALVITLLTS